MAARSLEAYASALATVAPQAPASLARYLQLLEEYSPVLDLTSLHGPQSLALEYVLAPSLLAGMAHLEPTGTTVDLGSGAGCPAVALASLLPGWRVVAIESRGRRCDFLLTVKAVLSLDNLSIECTRAEDYARLAKAPADLITARAFGKPELLMRLAALLLRPGGELRSISAPEQSELSKAAQMHGLQALQFEEVSKYGRVWHLFRAVRSL